MAAVAIGGACGLIFFSGRLQLYAGIDLGIALLAGVLFFRDALRQRASDLLFAPGGFRIEGGPHDGLALRFDQLDPSKCVIEQKTTSNSVRWWLFVALRSGGRLSIAVTENTEESRSFSALLETLRALASAGPARPLAPPRVSVLTCSGCGNLLPPADEASCRCTSCGASTPVPEPIRRGVREANELVRQHGPVARMVETLLGKQPHARGTNWFLGLSVIPIVLALPFVVAGLVGLIPVGLVLAYLHGRLADRRALRLLALDFSARGPMRPGGAPTCRCCGAPLPDSKDAAVARCAYCRAANVLGFDLGIDLSSARAQDLELDAAFAARKKARLQRRIALALAVPFLLASMTGFYFMARWAWSTYGPAGQLPASHSARGSG
jgi:hypothetical protein